MQVVASSTAPRRCTASRSPNPIPASDGRSWQALFRKRLRAALLTHIGDAPSITQGCLIDAAVDVSLELEMMKRRRDERGALSLGDAKVYLAYQNTLRRHLGALGIKGAPKPAPTLAELIRADRAQRGAAA